MVAFGMRENNIVFIVCQDAALHEGSKSSELNKKYMYILCLFWLIRCDRSIIYHYNYTIHLFNNLVQIFLTF